ncbi:MAG: 4-hydroxy-3-methylbut-2-enyl diphosphate reductase, partial [Clostridia bacterium]|nr:4-hydroxy-3-methylbut-2-enyl diphosphate reductase [Clostridia bacterium]
MRRAINLAVESAPAYTLGPLIHNSHAVSDLEKEGVYAKETVSEIPMGQKCVIRSHGIDKRTMDALSSRAEVIDATCPYVTLIHNMAHEAAENQKAVIVVGKREHPEVVGTLGWAGENAYVVSTQEEAMQLPEMEEAVVLAQTTIGDQMYDSVCTAISKRVKRPDIKNTVCAATARRQQEARALSKEKDVMLIVGDPLSSNTRMLFSIASENCARTYMIEDASGLRDIPVYPTDTIGITAGASTPDCTYKEVVARMNDIENKINNV